MVKIRLRHLDTYHFIGGIHIFSRIIISIIIGILLNIIIGNIYKTMLGFTLIINISFISFILINTMDDTSISTTWICNHCGAIMVSLHVSLIEIMLLVWMKFMAVILMMVLIEY